MKLKPKLQEAPSHNFLSLTLNYIKTPIREFFVIDSEKEVQSGTKRITPSYPGETAAAWGLAGYAVAELGAQELVSSVIKLGIKGLETMQRRQVSHEIGTAALAMVPALQPESSLATVTFLRPETLSHITEETNIGVRNLSQEAA
jgi:hypothetical protein